MRNRLSEMAEKCLKFIYIVFVSVFVVNIHIYAPYLCAWVGMHVFVFKGFVSSDKINKHRKMMLQIKLNQEYHGCGWNNNYSAMKSVKLYYTFRVHKLKKRKDHYQM